VSRSEDPTAEVTDILQLLIRNQCVNDGTIASGAETRSVDLLAGYLAGAGDHEIYEPQPGRQSLVVRMEGTDPDAPALLLMGHTDVVPVNPDGWSRDPFGAEVVDGFVWGRGAVDMLNLTASQAVAFRRLADSGFRPRGTLIFLAVADEEALGRWGADWLLQHERDAVYADYVLTEAGGFQIPTPAGPRLPVVVGEKGTFWTKIRVKGTPGHGSQPFRTDNALVTAAEVVRRIADYRPQTPRASSSATARDEILPLGLKPLSAS
jgi:acetylornithine deacetylase/succinyl-diaminopimelate desuccinylase-like protein